MKAFALLAILYLSGVPLSLALDVRGPYLTDVRPDQAVVIVHTKEDADLILECHEKTNPGPNHKRAVSKGATAYLLSQEFEASLPLFVPYSPRKRWNDSWISRRSRTFLLLHRSIPPDSHSLLRRQSRFEQDPQATQGGGKPVSQACPHICGEHG